MHAIVFTLMLAQSLFGGLPIDGISCERMEGAVEHIHSNLQLFDRGRAVRVPEQIGIEQNVGCLYWLHTHASNGIIHIESPVKRPFTLGQFFDIWGQPLDRTSAASVRGRLAVWVNGKRYAGDPRAIVLKDKETIVIQHGPPFATPKRADFSAL